MSDSVNSLNRYAYAEYAFATNISAKRSKFKTVLACFSQTQPDLNGDTENYTGTYFASLTILEIITPQKKRTYDRLQKLRGLKGNIVLQGKI